MSNSWWEGTPVVVTETFLLNGAPTDPTTVTFRVRDPDGILVVYAPPDPEVTNPSTGVYVLTLPTTLEPGVYYYRVEGTGAVTAVGEGEFTIRQSPTLSGLPDEQVLTHGPCRPWVSGEELECGVGTEDQERKDTAAVVASELLYMLSGQQFPGDCEHHDRPCARYQSCGWARGVVPLYGYASWAPWSGTWGWVWSDVHEGQQSCGCTPLSKIPLPGYATRIVEVVIDGDVVDPATYELRDNRWLVRVTPDPDEFPLLRWPSCQRMELPDGEAGTWSVTWLSGMPPPQSGIEAARQLGCQVYASMTPGLECALPDGVTQVTRQGITMSRDLFYQWGFQDGKWATGLPLVDGFLTAFNPNGLPRQTTVWSPDLEPYPEHA